jgi:nicotinamide-nucleotide amidase
MTVGVNPTAACVAVGSELLGVHRLDSNSLAVTTMLARYGVTVIEKRVVGDSVEHLAATIRELFDRVDVVVLTGGLGPTEDDVTREAVARALRRDLEVDEEVADWIRARYADHDRAMPEICLRMARIVHGGRPLLNPRGAAPGMLVESDGRLVVALPGVPSEMEEMLERDLAPELERRFPAQRLVTRTLLLGGVYESQIEDRIAPLYRRFGREHVTILASCGVVRLLVSARGEGAAAAARVDDMVGAFRRLLGDDVAGVDVGGLAQVVLERLERRSETLAVAESCTGGLVSARLTDVPGASNAFLGGVVSYSNAAKENLVDVPRELLVEHGAVSEPAARAMAVGVRGRFGSDWGIGITGIAGPSGGTVDKPVGLVHWAVAGAEAVVADYRVFPGDRATVRLWSVHSALDLLRRRLDGQGRTHD